MVIKIFKVIEVFFSFISKVDQQVNFENLELDDKIVYRSDTKVQINIIAKGAVFIKIKQVILTK